MSNTVLISGMHRSGTSATAAALMHLGVSLGSQDRMMKPALDNPQGYFELLDVSQFNEAVLHQRGRSWDSVSFEPLGPFDSRDTALARSLVFDCGEIVSCVKDPRISALLPLWRAALLDRILSLVLVRDPREVVWSLVVRDGMTPALAASLWIAHYSLISESSNGLNQRLIHYEDLVSQPAKTLRTIAGFLAERSTLDEVDDRRIQIASASIDPHLRQSTFPNWLDDHPLVEEAKGIHSHIRESGSLDVVNQIASNRNHRLQHLCEEVIQLHRHSLGVQTKIAEGRSQLGPELLKQLNRIDTSSAPSWRMSTSTYLPLLDVEGFGPKRLIREIEQLRQEISEIKSTQEQINRRLQRTSTTAIEIVARLIRKLQRVCRNLHPRRSVRRIPIDREPPEIFQD